MLKRLILFCLLIIAVSCENEDKREKEIAKIPVEVKVTRFDEKFARATADSLHELKSQFPYLFPSEYPDSVWVAKMSDSIQQELNQEVAREYSDITDVKQELRSLFQHIRYYFPETEIPEVVMLTSDVDYRNKAVWTNEWLLISLDTYLGKEHHFYAGIQEFLKKNFERSQILPDVTASFATTVVPRPDSRIFLAHMIYYGKLLYLKDLLIPFTTDAEKIGYTTEELEWAKANEDQIWRYFVERELLFETDSELYTRFLYPAPFSKFYLELDNEAPAQLGQFLGWQIVRHYMQKNEASLTELLSTDAQTLFNSSNYKPRK